VSYESKYIVGEIISRGDGMDQIVAVVFPQTVAHSDVAHVFKEDSILSAGFCAVNTDCEVTVYGKSISLKKECNPELDKKLVSRALGLTFK
jgi:hypothetical protein